MTATTFSQGVATSLFDQVTELIDASDIHSGMTQLFEGLHALRQQLPPDQWRQVVAEAAEHRLRDRIHQDPITNRSFNKPSGYAGDARLLDLIYGLDPTNQLAKTSPLGKELHQWLIQEQAALATQERLRIVGERISRGAATRSDFSVLSIACGHLREVQYVAEPIRRFVGLDQDNTSLSEVNSHSPWIETTKTEVRRVIGGRYQDGPFDFVYAAGLFDYLEYRTAERLTQIMFGLLKPGGSLLAANFLPDIPAVGFMETFMGWDLIYRSDEELSQCAAGIDQSLVHDVSTFHDSNDNIVFLEVTRR